MKPLPVEAQISVMYGIGVSDYDGDGKADILMGGNFYQSKPEAGIYDASYGILLKGDGKGNFLTIPSAQSGFFIKGAVRDMLTIKSKKKNLLLVARNNEPIKIFQ